MNATNSALRSSVAYPALAVDSGNAILILDYDEAMAHFVHNPIMAKYGLDLEAVLCLFNDEWIFSKVTSYDSIAGREGFRLAHDLTEDRYWQLVDSTPNTEWD